ncbi:response regulator [Jiella marina]|uniref:response regulator n=1 Tax=Jiella sp. LLJ827 TaxID=2917712 RepID=UPI002101A9EE|nr:response regulator [Jiella sp. LLJ827]MCQ0990484.1 response regulator [Jiella sp. LLJ827]
MSAQPTPTVVLVIEDEPLLRMMAVELIEEAGFTAIEAGDGAEALRILESRGDVGIVFSDVDLPGGMNGIDLAAMIRDRWPAIEIILTSGHAEFLDRQFPDGVAFFQKPARHTQIIAKMRLMAAARHQTE